MIMTIPFIRSFGEDRRINLFIPISNKTDKNEICSNPKFESMPSSSAESMCHSSRKLL
jgi:hypothetical protein